MELVKVRIPAAFLSARTQPSWREFRFGLENELVEPSAAIELAAEQVAALDHPPAVLVALASAERDDPLQGLVDQLADSEPESPEDKVREKWLYFVLAWVYEHRASYPDPLQVVEEIYADFGYPQRIAGFVRYMPLDEPDLGSREANERRLLERWKRYIEESATSIGKAAGSQ